MRYPYLNAFYPEETEYPIFSRPILPITLFGPAGTFEIADAIVDSGADFSLFHSSYAEQVGIDLRKGTAVSISGIGSDVYGTLIDAKISIEKSEKNLEIPIIFSDDINMVLLGQIGFFDAYTVRFERKKGFFYIVPVTKK